MFGFNFNIKPAWFYCVAVAALAIALAGCSNNSKDPIETRIEELISQMTLQEKIGQLNQVNFMGSQEQMCEMITQGNVGSILNEADPQRIRQYQKLAVDSSRLSIPLIIGRDVIHGFKTIFPIPLGQAATFDPSLVKEAARIAAREASSTGIRWTFAPMIDISRDPRWGRIAESCGEDPYLTSILGVAMVEGFQGEQLNDPASIAACAKHFVGYGAAEGGRDYNTTLIPERQMRNVYMPSFEAASRAGAQTFMTSFNDNDGVPTTGSRWAVTDVLRGEWGFDGFVVSDWNSMGEMLNHGFCADVQEVASRSMDAGVDMDMMSFSYIKGLEQMVKDGKIKESQIDDAVRNVLRVKFRLGLFDNPYPEEVSFDTILYAPAHLAAAKQAALESAILLKNDGILPLGPQVKRVAIVGPMADAPYDQMGTWVFDGESDHTITPLAAIRSLSEKGITVNYAPGVEYSLDKSTKGIAQAVTAARNSDVVLAFVGEESILTGEAHSLADLNLKGAQNQLISELAATGKPLVMVVMAGRPLTIGEQADLSNAVLYSFHPGTMGGPAIADLLWGVATPSGKTPVTFPKTVGQVPIYYAHHNTGRPFQGNEILLDDITRKAGQTSLGNTSYYLDAGNDPLYPFGYGLSYTTFSYSTPELSAHTLDKDGVLKVTCDITNTGDRPGTEVAQLYVRDLVGSIARPVRELKGFERVTLQGGQTKTVTFTLPMEQLAFYGYDMKKKVEPGDFQLWVAGDSQSGDPVVFTVK